MSPLRFLSLLGEISDETCKFLRSAPRFYGFLLSVSFLCSLSSVFSSTLVDFIVSDVLRYRRFSLSMLLLSNVNKTVLTVGSNRCGRLLVVNYPFQVVYKYDQAPFSIRLLFALLIIFINRLHFLFSGLFLWFNIIIEFQWCFMSDSIQRKMQDLQLGSHKPAVQLSSVIVQRANQFVLIGRPLIPQRQNLRTMVAVVPRSWNLEGSVHGRIIDGRRFQFIFPTEESLLNVLRRGPWSFNERMIVLQRWTPTFNPVSLNFIPFWIQIRGIPFHLIDHDVILAIGRELGDVIDIDYSVESAIQVNFVRVCVNWCVHNPLEFQPIFLVLTRD